jgi:hypothetical protein
MLVYLFIWNSAVNGIVVTLRKKAARLLAGARYFSLLRMVQIGARIHSVYL